MGDLLTAEQWQQLWGILEGTATLGGVIAVIGGTLAVMYKGMTAGLLLRRKRRLTYLKKRQAWLRQLYESDRAYIGYLLSGILWVLVLFGVLLIFEGSMAQQHFISPRDQQLADLPMRFTRYMVGVIAYIIALQHVIVDYMLRRRYERFMGALDRRIAKLEVKLGLSPASATVPEAVLRP
jgi:hypothetical protein